MFGGKIHWYQLREIALVLGGGASREPHARERAVIERVFPRCSYVFVVRRDRDRQAVSWAIAEATSQWTDLADGAPRPEVAYDYAVIDDCRRRIDEAERGWASLLGTPACYQSERSERGAAPGATPPLRGSGLFADAHPETFPG